MIDIRVRGDDPVDFPYSLPVKKRLDISFTRIVTASTRPGVDEEICPIGPFDESRISLSHVQEGNRNLWLLESKVPDSNVCNTYGVYD